MPRNRIAGKARVRDLTSTQKVNLMIGRNAHGVGPGYAFESEDDRRVAWENHREELLAAAVSFRRPAAYWDYDCPFERIPFETDLQALHRLGLLTPDEITGLVVRGGYPPDPATGEDPRELLWQAGP